jgi:hypothetical protein
MRFLVSISNPIVLTAKQLEKLVAVVDGCEVKVSEWVGTGKGINGTNYIDKINQPKVEDMLTLKVLSQIEYDALITMTKLRAEAE